MKKHWTKIHYNEDGNALIYVLIAVVLFAALGFTVARQAQDAGTTELNSAKLEFYASEVIGYSAQAKSVLDQMMFTGSNISDLDFTKPAQAGFNAGSLIHRIYHPQGGGLDTMKLDSAITLDVESEPAGWYMVNFGNVEWTNSVGTDVILTAYQINQQLCQLLNKKITGSTTIPALSSPMKNYFVDTSTNVDLEIANCAACEGYMSLCVSNSAGTSFSFYSVIAER